MMEEKNRATGSGRFAAAGEAAVKRLNRIHRVRCLKATALPLCGGGLLVILEIIFFYYICIDLYHQR